MTGVIYARYSSDNQHEASIEGQIRENTAFAENRRYLLSLHLFCKLLFAFFLNLKCFALAPRTLSNPLARKLKHHFFALCRYAELSFSACARNLRGIFIYFI